MLSEYAKTDVSVMKLKNQNVVYDVALLVRLNASVFATDAQSS